MRPALAAALLPAILALCGCDRTQALEAQAQAAVARALPRSGATVIDLLHTDVAQGVVCGLVTAGDAGDRSPFIVRTGVAKIYPAATGWPEARQLATTASGSERASIRLQIGEGCDFQAAWAKMCAPTGSPIKPADPELCRLWRTGQLRTLLDRARP